MASGLPRRDWPNLMLTGNPGAQLPRTELALDLGKTGNDFVHVRALAWILLDHVDDQWLNELEAFAFLGCMSGRCFIEGLGQTFI